MPVLAAARALGCLGWTGLGWAGLGWWWYLLVRAAGGLAQCSGPYWPQGDIGILLLSSKKRRHGIYIESLSRLFKELQIQV